ncbi:MAG: hypothetical protein DHS20C17_17670 [Cyclobacteriaceae bacterium]|nr:MAG: hypothetical protein DHS20C17_17670 [Cyclobacteriaceae bacterium]
MAPCLLIAQLTPGVYKAHEQQDEDRTYLLFVSPDYMIHTVYHSNPNDFVVARGGFYNIEGDSLVVELEFNSNFETDGAKQHRAMIAQDGETLIFNGNEQQTYIREPSLEQPLDGRWLFATRGPDTGQERRGEENPRKTLKFLKDGYFQWVAYHTETMNFSGTGGGRYTAEDGTYTEVIQFFSRDPERVGAELKFQYEIEGNDWHHKGKNSRGEPMYEIWGKR